MPPGPSTALEVLETEHTHTHEHNSLHTGKAEAKGNLSRLGADIWLYPITIRKPCVALLQAAHSPEH